MKTCKKCGKRKPFSKFVKDKRCKDGVAGTCLQCHNSEGRERREERKRGAQRAPKAYTRRKPGQRGCKEEDCDRPHKGRGWCEMHLRRVRKYGSPDAKPGRVYERLSEDEVATRCHDKGYEYVAGYTTYRDPFSARHAVCGDIVHITLQALKDERVAEGCSCRLIQRTHKMYGLGYYLIDTWSDTEDGWRRYNIVQHLECGWDFLIMETSVISGHVSGPHPCNPKWVDPDMAFARYEEQGGLPNGPYPGKSDVPWHGKCTQCWEPVQPIWDQLNSGQGVCFLCGKKAGAQKLKMPEAEVLAILQEANVRPAPTAPVPSLAKPLEDCHCVTCGDPVTTRPINLRMGNRTGCSCTPRGYGFDPASLGMGYVIERQLDGQLQRKYGIMNEDSPRLVQHYRNGWGLIDLTTTRDGSQVRDEERQIHQALSRIGIRGKGLKGGKFDGYTESFRPEKTTYDTATWSALLSI